LRFLLRMMNSIPYLWPGLIGNRNIDANFMANVH
jgi:hypothetical protein